MADPALQQKETPETAALRQEYAKKLEAGGLELPPLPRVAQQVLALASSDSADAAELARLIQEDQSLAGHVFRYANSTSFMARHPIRTLQQAVARMGMALISEVALAVSVRGKVFSAPGFEETVARLWHHAAASGTWGKEIARLRRRNVESAYLCGLLHNIGKPIALQDLSGLGRSLGLEPAHDSILALLEEFHTQVGMKAAEQWGLPAQVTASIGYFQRYEEAPSFGEEATITYCADLLADWSLDPDTVSEDDIGTDPVMQALNFYPTDVQELLGKAGGVAEMVEAMLI